MLTIIASMEHELAGLRRELRPGRAPGHTSRPHRGEGSSTPELRVVGVGRRRAEAQVRSLLGQGQRPSGRHVETPAALLMLGFAGAVDSALGTGDLVLASRYYRADSMENPPNRPLAKADPAAPPLAKADPAAPPLAKADPAAPPLAKADPAAPPLAKGGDGGGYLTPDPAMWRWAVDAASHVGQPVAHVDSLTVEAPVTTPAAKRSLGRSYPIGIVEMEDYWAAAVAREAGVPFLSARVVLDPADQALPGYLPSLARSRMRAAFGVVFMPWRILTLASLARQLPAAQRALTRFALSFVAQAAVSGSTQPYPAAASCGIQGGRDWSVPE